jgi:flagellin-like hook-associated protein FlgL
VGYLEHRKETLETEALNLTERMSEIEDTDIVESILYLEQEELAYQAALSLGSQLFNSSILNFFE